MISPAPSYHGYRFPPDIIAHAVWLYFRFNLSFRDVEDLLAQRGVTVTYETIRRWCRTFGHTYARRLRQRRGRLGDTWYLDEVFVTLNGRQQYLWRAVDEDGDLLDILVQSRRSVASTDPTARAADAPLQVPRPSATLCGCTRRRPESLPGRPTSAAVCSPPLASQPSIRRMGCGDVCLLTEARGALDQGEECLSSIKLTEPLIGTVRDSRAGDTTRDPTRVRTPKTTAGLDTQD